MFLRVGLLSLSFLAVASSHASVVFAEDGPGDPAKAPAVQGEQGQQGPDVRWQNEGTGKLGRRGTIAIPEGHVFLEGKDTSTLLTAMGNLSGGDELGLIGVEGLDWFAVFLFDEVGFVKDDEKDKLDADEMAEGVRESLEEGNKVREERGLTVMAFDGWAMPPRYNAQTQQLEWASRFSSTDGVSVNYHTRILGRMGVMRVILVTAPEQLDATLPKFQEVMKGFAFTDGQLYSQFVAGDKIAEYGLIALVAGGAGAVAAKTGLLGAALVFLKKGAKLVVVAVIAAAAFIKKLFSRRGSRSGSTDQGPDAPST